MKNCSVRGLCRLCAISTQGYYKQQCRRTRIQYDKALVVSLIMSIRAIHPRMGTRKLLHQLAAPLCKAGISMGRDRLFELLKEYQLLVEPKKRSARTTYSEHNLPLYRNLLYELQPTAPNQVWVADITYVSTQEGFLYLSLITDLFSRKIVGYHTAKTLTAEETIKALEHALRDLPKNRFPIHHSDRGCQYCSHLYTARLHNRGLSISMTEDNHCYENCYAERVNGILKLEYNLDRSFKNIQQAKQAIDQTITIYNNCRPHGSLDMNMPSVIHKKAA